MKSIPHRIRRLLAADSYLAPYENIIARRLQKIAQAEQRLSMAGKPLTEFASGHEYFGLHFREGQWVFREWAPNATAINLVGDMTGWMESPEFALNRIEDPGVWEIRLPADRIGHGQLYRLKIAWPGGSGDRIPAYARRVVQDPQSLIFNAQVWRPDTPYHWKHTLYRRPDVPPLIYEAHIGMAQEDARIGSFQEFTVNTLPRIIASGYNTLQLMAIPEHPYYGSFGYQVSSFFAPSSRFGPPEDLKALVDTAHAAGLTVVMDLIHSHAVSNEVEGISRFDGTLYQYFHDGPRGRHHAWDSRCFDYGRLQVMHFLLSNCRYWLDEFHFDGFRFDGITSMLYLDHGLEKAFTSYDDYFGNNVDEDALVYLSLANRLVHELRPDAITIAEDISGMPGLAASPSEGGIGFDYRFAMGVPDYWIRLVKDTKDENWPMGHLWYELTNRRSEEKTISYAESHDQALVGDQSLIFRLIGADMYDHMHIESDHLGVNRGMALHKLIRLITLATAGSGYMNFMGNEFGHPEWIDFPREGNNWSYHYARRQWHLLDNHQLKYHLLARFDRQMVAMAHQHELLASSGPHQLYEHGSDQVICFERAGLIFAFNFHPERSYTDYQFPAPAGTYQTVLDSDAPEFGGHGRNRPNQIHHCVSEPNSDRDGPHLSLYLPSRSAQVLATQ